MGVRSVHAHMRRPHSKRATKARTLIVFGAEKSERIYVENLISHHRVSSSTIKIYDFAFTPERLVQETKKIVKDEVKQGENFDHVFCVVDRDDFAHFDRAKSDALKNNFHFIESHPCFEYWLLIHFKQTDMPFMSKGELSVGKVCYDELKSVYEKYGKNSKTVYADLLENQEKAMVYAERIYQRALENKDFNPSSNFYIMVRHLLAMAE